MPRALLCPRTLLSLKETAAAKHPSQSSAYLSRKIHVAKDPSESVGHNPGGENRGKVFRDLRARCTAHAPTQRPLW